MENVGGDKSLTLLHLRKTFSSIVKDAHGALDDSDLEKLLPLFNKLMSMYTPDELCSNFKEVAQFSAAIADVLVNEIRRRANNESTNEAASSVYEFLRAHPLDSRGWLLLKSLNFVVSSNQPKVLEAVCRASLPSTFVKLFYLFFDLPTIDQSTEMEYRRRLYDSVVTLMVTMCSFDCVAEELIQKDDLVLLFIGASSTCANEHSMWRDANFTFLCTIINKSMNSSVLKYIHSKGCVGHYMKQLRNQQLDDTELSTFLSNIIDLLKISAEYTNLLIEDMINVNGFQFITEFCERASTTHIKPLLGVLVNLISAGNQTIPLANPQTTLSFYPFQLNAECARSSTTVRIPEAFQVLVRSFHDANDEKCLIVLEHVQRVLKMETMNYFVLEKHYPFSLFVERMVVKSMDVQKKVLNIVEHILRDLNFIPCRELTAINNHLRRAAKEKDFDHIELYLHFLFGILSINVHIKDAYRELLHLETFLNIVQFQHDLANLSVSEKIVVQRSLDLLVATTKNNSMNAQFITENLEIRTVKQILSSDDEQFADFRSTMKTLIKNLLFLAKNEQLFSSLLQILFSDPGNIDVCMKILEMFGSILLESHKVRIMFRRSGGYICLMTLLLQLENTLNLDPEKTLTDHHKRILTHVTLIFRVLTLSMRYEPSNARYFLNEVKPAIIVSVLRTMGCFGAREKVNVAAPVWSEIQVDQIRPQLKLCHSIFESVELDFDSCNKLPPRLLCALYLLRVMFNLAMDNFGKPNCDIQWAKADWLSSAENVEIIPVVTWTRSVLVHPSPVLCILQLLPAVSTNDNVNDKDTNLPDQWTAVAQFYVSLVLKALLRSERNQQVMCEYDMPRLVLEVGEDLFKIEKHTLLSPFHYLFERLACQSLHPRELRRFLRLDQPLCCTNLDDEDETNKSTVDHNDSGGSIPIHRVKALVSMLTPRNHALVHPPPFVDFDLAVEGFACLFAPSLASNQSSQSNSTTNDRLFPPVNGLTYMTWFYLDECPSTAMSNGRTAQVTTIRLLAIVRNFDDIQIDSHGRTIRESTSLENYLTCLYVHLDLSAKCVIVCTKEHSLVDELRNDYTQPEPSDKCVRFPLTDAHLSLRQWNHLCVVLSRSLLKQSQTDLYMNGRLIGSQKLSYIQPNVGGAQAQIVEAHSAHALIGTPPFLRRASNMRWRMAGTFLIEDVIANETIRSIYQLQPHYVGNFQNITGTAPLISEEKILLSITANSTSELNLQVLRSMIRKTDSELVASLLGISINDNSTPLKILWNCAAHAIGPSRSLGAIMIGYLGMRTFAPNPVSALLESIGGAAPLLGLVAMCSDSHGLYASLKVLVSAVQTNRAIAESIERNRGYQTLAVLLEEKMHFFNSHILHLVLALAGTLDLSNELTIIPNQQIFEDLLCDLNLWSLAPDEVKKLLFEHFYELVIDNNCDNLAKVRASSLLNRLLIMIVEKPSAFIIRNDILFRLIGAIIQPPCDVGSFLRFGQAIAATLPTQSPQVVEPNERQRNFPFHIAELERLLNKQVDDTEATLTANATPQTDENLSAAIDSHMYAVYVRKRLLNILSTMLAHSSGQVNHQLCECVVNSLGFGWLLALCGPGVHTGTVFLSLRILLAVTKHPNLMQQFKDGTSNGGWLQEADSVIRNRAAVLLGFSVSARTGAVGSHVDVNPELANCAGFAALEQLMGQHADQPFAYLAMLALLFNQHNANIQPIEEFNVDLIWSHVFSLNVTSSVYDAIAKVDYCPEALIPLFAMLRVGLHFNDENNKLLPDNHWSQNYSLIIVQLVSFLYQNLENFISVCHTDTFVIVLFTVLVPPRSATTQPAQTPSTLLGSNNRCARSILDMLANILLNDLCLQHDETHTEWLFDALVEFLDGGGAMHSFQSSIFTDLVNTCLERFMSSDMFFTNSSLMVPKSAEGQLNHSSECTAINVVHFLSRVIDSVWSCLYRGNPVKILKCFLKLLAEAHVLNKATAQLACTEGHLTALFRIVLYLLSRPIDNVDTQMSVVDTLAEIIRNQHLLLSANSNNPLFYGALVHLIFMLSEPPDLHSQVTNQHLQRGSAQVSVCAQSVWGILWQQKKPLLEEIFKRSIELDLYSARAACGETANRYWLQFVDIQAAGSTSSSQPNPATSLTQSARQVGGQLQQQIQSRLSRVARSGLKRLTSRTGLGTSTTSFDKVFVPAQFHYERPKVEPETFHMWIRVHVSLLKEFLRSQSQRYVEWHTHVRKWSMQEWQNTEAELTRERGLWGPEQRSKLDKFQLDITEGPCRVRKKLLPDPKFYHRYPYRPHLDIAEAKPMRAKVAISRDSRSYYEKMRLRRYHTMDERIVDMTTAAPVSTLTTSNQQVMDEQLFDPTAELNLSMIKRMVQKNLVIRDQERENSQSVEEPLDAEDEEAETKITENVNDEAVVEEIGSPHSFGEEHETEKEVEASQPEAPQQSTTNNEKSNGRITTKIDENVKRSPSKTLVGNEPDNQTLLRLLEDGEHLHSMFRCARVQGLDTVEGLLLFGRHHFYVVDGFTLLKTKEIRDLDFLPEQYHDPIIPYMAMGSSNRPSTRANRQCSKFAYDGIREVHKRRYLLQPIALEVFSADGRNYLLAFPRKIRDRVHQKIVAMSKNCATESMKMINEQRKLISAESGIGAGTIFGQFLQIGQQTMVQRWQRGEISNFNYLMYLNTMAGRTYNDLSQYPIFPWILKDYDSEVLDLTKPETFRDLSKPMGAQTPERLAQFLKRFHEWDDPTGDTPPYMYGTHYSSAMIVLSYLVRLEPFTQQFLKLQGGHFDLADRMFHSIRDAWMSASKNNMADVKELIPEFFYLPEFLQNANAFDLGAKQSGVVLDNVVLPQWAHGDQHEFIRLHRQVDMNKRGALECDYVSEHLHEWIDLIFGYKQNGDSACSSFNVFHHLFYEENVDFDNIADPLTRNATFGFINNFGQIPAQLFKKPHPQKKMSALTLSSTSNDRSQALVLIQTIPGVTCPKLFYHALETLRPSKRPVKELRAAVGDITVNDKNQVIVLEQNKVLLPPTTYISWGFYDRSVRMGQVGNDKSICIFETNDVYQITCMAATDNRQVFAGLTTGSILVWDLETNPRRSLSTRSNAHSGAPTSTLAAAATGATAVSVAGVVTDHGSNSSTGVGANSTSGGLSTRQTPMVRAKKVLSAHTDGVTALAICTAHNFIVSASRDHTAVVWHLTQLTYIRQLVGHSAAVSAVTTNEATGDIATASGSFLFLWTLNGDQLARINTAEAGLFSNTSSLILCLAFSTLNAWDARNVVMCGTKDGLVKFYSVEYKKGSANSESTSNSANPKTSTTDHKALKEHFLKRQRRIHSHGTRLSSRDISEDSQASSPTHTLSSGADDERGDQTADNPEEATSPQPTWNRHCKLRRVLTEQSAYASYDSQRTAPITSICPSWDHRHIYVGDSRGCVWMWSMEQGSGLNELHGSTNHGTTSSGNVDLKRASTIITTTDNTERSGCIDCHRQFAGSSTKTVAASSAGVAQSRFNCKNCGQWFCENCINEEMNSKISMRRIQVCRSCSTQLAQRRSHRNSTL
ncbi:Beige/BEACH domain-containing protein [Aphelenchoides besseyi]|nr:Beige/BEACH domain-containing protein [Aphelenchoides besseyi]